MERSDLIRGKDWLDMINPLVDCRNNTMFIRSGDKLHTVSSIPIVTVKPCGIKDEGHAGVQDSVSRIQNEVSAPFQFGKWGELCLQLAFPTLWEYKSTTKD